MVDDLCDYWIWIVHSLIYSFASFGSYILYNGDLIEITFKAIISLTLGLAVFDLGKNLIEHEVVFKENNSHEKSGSKMFIKFLISIITALSIEALMLVLKISLTKEYSDMTYALNCRNISNDYLFINIL